jgi:hypothetical protein
MTSEPYTPHERALLREAHRFLRGRLREIEAMPPPSRRLRRRLARTAAFRRVDGLDTASDDELWDTWATLHTCFERGLEDVAAFLRDALQNKP